MACEFCATTAAFNFITIGAIGLVGFLSARHISTLNTHRHCQQLRPHCRSGKPHQAHVAAIVQQAVDRRRFPADAPVGKPHQLRSVRFDDRLGALLPRKFALVISGHFDHAAEGEPDAEECGCHASNSHAAACSAPVTSSMNSSAFAAAPSRPRRASFLSAR